MPTRCMNPDLHRAAAPGSNVGHDRSRVSLSHLEHSGVAVSPYPREGTQHQKVARVLEAALALGGLEHLLTLARVLRAKLTAEERQDVAWAVLSACGDEEVEAVVDAVLPRDGAGAGPPLPPLFDEVEEQADEAAAWAEIASPRELRVYAVACFSRLPPQERAVILESFGWGPG